MKDLIPGIPGEHASRIFQLLSGIPGVEQVVLFGSRAKGNFREGSDIDVALKGASISAESLSAFVHAYDKLFLPWKIDVIVYESITTPALREHIDRIGKLLVR